MSLNPEDLTTDVPAQETNEPQDIDPAAWLTASSSGAIGFVDLKAGRLKIAALSEKESEQIRKRSETINPANPRGNKTLNLTKMRKETVATSINKAYGYGPADPRFISADRLSDALTGEITTIVSKITELSGFTEEESGPAGELFQVS